MLWQENEFLVRRLIYHQPWKSFRRREVEKVFLDVVRYHWIRYTAFVHVFRAVCSVHRIMKDNPRSIKKMKHTVLIIKLAFTQSERTVQRDFQSKLFSRSFDRLRILIIFANLFSKVEWMSTYRIRENGKQKSANLRRCFFARYGAARIYIYIYCNKFENSREAIFSKLVRVLDRHIFRLIRMKKKNRRFTRTTLVGLSQGDEGQT